MPLSFPIIQHSFLLHRLSTLSWHLHLVFGVSSLSFDSHLGLDFTSSKRLFQAIPSWASLPTLEVILCFYNLCIFYLAVILICNYTLMDWFTYSTQVSKPHYVPGTLLENGFSSKHKKDEISARMRCTFPEIGDWQYTNKFLSKVVSE